MIYEFCSHSEYHTTSTLVLGSRRRTWSRKQLIHAHDMGIYSGYCAGVMINFTQSTIIQWNLKCNESLWSFKRWSSKIEQLLQGERWRFHLNVSSQLWLNIVFYLFAASDARERQHWVNRLRATAEYHTAHLAQVSVGVGMYVMSVYTSHRCWNFPCLSYIVPYLHKGEILD